MGVFIFIPGFHNRGCPHVGTVSVRVQNSAAVRRRSSPVTNDSHKHSALRDEAPADSGRARTFLGHHGYICRAHAMLGLLPHDRLPDPHVQSNPDLGPSGRTRLVSRPHIVPILGELRGSRHRSHPDPEHQADAPARPLQDLHLRQPLEDCTDSRLRLPPHSKTDPDDRHLCAHRKRDRVRQQDERHFRFRSGIIRRDIRR